ncbi:hypothetical protein [Pseudophaeobacter sp.]|uniref:hypothetical protein n=1 Tax=Pseudophaeobacter sp. TaxID=1971739 RepID=UPI00260241AE|nr:hypothetical protein [Pseudophaeobacter sp.]
MPNGFTNIDLLNIIKVLERDAFVCHSDFVLLKNMELAAKKIEIEKSSGSRDLFRKIWENAQTGLMISLSRLLDNGTNAISVSKLKGDQRFKQPSNAKDIRKNFNREIHKCLNDWRTNLLAHSLRAQIEENIPSTAPLSIHDLGRELSVCLQLIHAYATENEISVSNLPDRCNPVETEIWPEVEAMARGIASVRLEN